MVYVIFSVLKIPLPHLDNQVYDTLVSGFPQKLKTVNLAYSPTTKCTNITQCKYFTSMEQERVVPSNIISSVFRFGKKDFTT